MRLVTVAIAFHFAAVLAHADNSRLLKSVKPEDTRPKPVEGFRTKLQQMKQELGLLNYSCLEGLTKAKPGQELLLTPIFKTQMAKVAACIEADQKRPNSDAFEMCLQGAIGQLYTFIFSTAYPSNVARVCAPPPPPGPVEPHAPEAAQKVEEAQRFMRDNAVDKAEPLFDEVIAQFTKDLGPRPLGRVCATNDEELRAILVARPDRQGATAVSPSLCEALHGKAQILARKKSFEDALGFLEREALLRPTDMEVLIARGETLTQLQRYRDASRAFEQALRGVPAAETITRARVLLGFAAAQVGMNNLTAARKAAAESIKLDPSNAVAKDELRYIETLEQQKRASPNKR